jgi:hypothetical protein
VEAEGTAVCGSVAWEAVVGSAGLAEVHAYVAQAGAAERQT